MDALGPASLVTAVFCCPSASRSPGLGRRASDRIGCAAQAAPHLNNSRVVSKKLTTMTPVKILGASSLSGTGSAVISSSEEAAGGWFHRTHSIAVRDAGSSGEFDPGSGRTLAARLIHASRTGCLRAASGGRVSNTWVTCPPVGNNAAKAALIPHHLSPSAG